MEKNKSMSSRNKSQRMANSLMDTPEINTGSPSGYTPRLGITPNDYIDPTN